MEKFAKIFFLALCMVAMAGCIRDKIEPCPPLTVTLEVTDKNWFNIDEVAAEGLAEPMDENLPFREFVQSLSSPYNFLLFIVRYEWHLFDRSTLPRPHPTKPAPPFPEE